MLHQHFTKTPLQNQSQILHLPCRIEMWRIHLRVCRVVLKTSKGKVQYDRTVMGTADCFRSSFILPEQSRHSFPAVLNPYIIEFSRGMPRLYSDMQ